MEWSILSDKPRGCLSWTLPFSCGIWGFQPGHGLGTTPDPLFEDKMWFKKVGLQGTYGGTYEWHEPFLRLPESFFYTLHRSLRRVDMKCAQADQSRHFSTSEVGGPFGKSHLHQSSMIPWKKHKIYSHMRTMVLVYKNLQNWVILFRQMLINIPAPWSIWDR